MPDLFLVHQEEVGQIAKKPGLIRQMSFLFTYFNDRGAHVALQELHRCEF